MRLARWILLGLIAATLQAGIVPAAELGGVKPDLVLLAVLFAALFAPARHVLPLAWFMGTLEDILSTGRFGIYGAVYLAMAYMVLDAREDLFREHPVTHLMVTLLHAFLVFVVVGLLSALAFETLSALAAVRRAFAATLYTTAVALPVFAAAGWATGIRRTLKRGRGSRRAALG